MNIGCNIEPDSVETAWTIAATGVSVVPIVVCRLLQWIGDVLKNIAHMPSATSSIPLMQDYCLYLNKAELIFFPPTNGASNGTSPLNDPTVVQVMIKTTRSAKMCFVSTLLTLGQAATFVPRTFYFLPCPARDNSMFLNLQGERQSKSLSTFSKRWKA